MRKSPDTIKQEILDFIKNNDSPIGLPIKDIAKGVGLSNTTASKYLESLVSGKRLKRKTIGNVKLHYLNQVK